MTFQEDPLLTPFQLRGLKLRNRIVMSPMTRCFSPGGVPGQNVADYYARRAERKVGLIITEGVGVDHPAALGAGSMDEQNVPVLHGETALAGWRRVVDAVHAASGLIFPQLWHMGPIRQANTGPAPEAPSCRPSGLWGPSNGLAAMPPAYVTKMLGPTRPMSDREIADVLDAFGRSAANAKAIGFDGIAIHGAHGYLIDSFFWHETNHRTDRWGGDLAMRAGFGAEVVRSVRRAVGPDLPVLLRYSQWKLQDYNGYLARSPAELESMLRPLTDAGVDIFDASTRRFQEPAFADAPLTLAGWTKKLSGKPCMAVGGIGLQKDLPGTFENGSESLDNLPEVRSRMTSGEFDLIAVGRSILGDPDWVTKVERREPFRRFNLQSFATLE
ncbi:MAG TPA: NADH:flavin oxidoreductase [Steroidobacteraceae bacterium]|jgi:2,4-dienoyl-CoA reductase-like NADH-dependent reductase (Old Yellow Enzyme family)|nr:NADH:flavin oxidoreductase [Steroidobacteraceae bacterium]